MIVNHSTTLKDELIAAFPTMRENEPLARFTSARIGGPAEYFLEAHSSDDLISFAEWLWARDIPFRVLGGGSNVLVSDNGLPGVTLLNNAKSVNFLVDGMRISIEAESGANLGTIARQAAVKGLTGLEWAAGIPGTLGGAIVGNAGAHGSDMSSVLIKAQVLHRINGKQDLALNDLGFAYRSSMIKSQLGENIVISALLQVSEGNKESIREKMAGFCVDQQGSHPFFLEYFLCFLR